MPVPRPLSASPLGQPIGIGTNAAPGTLIHTSVAGRVDMARLVVSNTNVAARVLTLIIAGAAAAQQLEHDVPADSTIELPLIPVADGQSIFAFGEAIDDLRICGDVTPY